MKVFKNQKIESVTINAMYRSISNIVETQNKKLRLKLFLSLLRFSLVLDDALTKTKQDTIIVAFGNYTDIGTTFC